MSVFSKQFTRREKVLMTILGLLLISAAYFFLIHQPVTNALSDMAFQKTDAESQIAALETMAEKRAAMLAELEAIHATPGVVEIPAYDNLQQVMVFLNTTLSTTTDYSLGFQPVSLPAEGNIVRRVISMSFQSPGYDDARLVLNALHNGAYRCQLGDLSITPTQGVAPLEPGRSPSLTNSPVRVSLNITFYEIIK